MQSYKRPKPLELVERIHRSTEKYRDINKERRRVMRSRSEQPKRSRGQRTAKGGEMPGKNGGTNFLVVRGPAAVGVKRDLVEYKTSAGYPREAAERWATETIKRHNKVAQEVFAHFYPHR